jgi:hypothetical protein
VLQDVEAAALDSLDLFPTTLAHDATMLKAHLKATGDGDENDDSGDADNVNGNDEKMLGVADADPLGDFNTRNCVVMRHGEKTVLTQLVRLARECR